MISIEDQYTPEEVYRCFMQTKKILGIDEKELLQILEKKNKGLGKYIREYTRSSSLRRKDPSRNIKILSGPHRITFFRDVQGKRILLLGEQHNNIGQCTPETLAKKNAFRVADWLVELGRNAPACLDIYTETDYQKNTRLCPDERSHLNLVRCKFDELIKNKELPLHIRYHNIDVRIFKGYVFPTVMFAWKMGDPKNSTRAAEFSRFTDDYVLNRNKDHIKVVEYLLTIDRSKDAQAVYNAYMESIYSFVNGIRYDATTDNLNFEGYTRLIDKEFAKSSITDKSKFLLALKNTYLRNRSFYAFMIAVNMDLYFLVRLFINFDATKIKRGPKGCQYSENGTSNNVIVYGGSAHTLIYELFFAEYFGILPTLEIGGKSDYHKKCLTFKKQFDFFTS